MADNYNVQELTAHYVALAQNDPQKFQRIRGTIQLRFAEFADRSSVVEKSGRTHRDDEIDAIYYSVNNWFDQIAQTAQQLQAGNAAAQASYDTACKTLSTTIKNIEDKFEKSEDEPTFNYSNYLKDVYSPDEDDEIEFQGKEILRQIGPKKTAAKCIEEVQDEVKELAEPTAEHIATVLAARQIANAIPGKRGRLDDTKIDSVTLKERADKLLASGAFQDFLKEHEDPEYPGTYTINPALLTDGHGGKLEEVFAASVQSRPDLQDLPKDLYRRYQRPPRKQFDSYEAFIEAGKRDFLKNGMERITPDDKEAALHAARMLTAFRMKQKGKVYNQKYFDQKTMALYRSPQFQFIRKHDPQKLNLLTTGNFNTFADVVNHYVGEAKQADADHPERMAERKNLTDILANGMRAGTVFGTVAQRKEKDDYMHGMETFRKSYKFLGHSSNIQPKELTNLLDALDGYRPEERQGLIAQANTPRKKKLSGDEVKHLYDTTKEMVRYLAEHEGNAAADKLRAELMKVVQTGELYFNPPEFKDKKNKTAQQQLKDYEDKCAVKFRNAAQKFYERFVDARTKDYESKRKAAEAYLGKPSMLKYSLTPDTTKKSTNAENKPDVYLSKRGPKYRAMVDAAKEYTESFNFEEDSPADPAKTMKVVDAILDYQNGKEKPMSGAAGDRFNNSMRLLAVVTMGTPMEKYLDQQIAHINEVRGVHPGDKNFITKEMYFEGFAADKQPAQPQAQPAAPQNSL